MGVVHRAEANVVQPATVALHQVEAIVSRVAIIVLPLAVITVVAPPQTLKLLTLQFQITALPLKLKQ